MISITPPMSQGLTQDTDCNILLEFWQFKFYIFFFDKKHNCEEQDPESGKKGPIFEKGFVT